MSTDKNSEQICGIVMPISSIDGCTESHWIEVLGILSDAISDSGFKPNLVSESDDSGIIHKRIIENLYDNPVVVCDVSGKNPNVMFELGMRLAFDKPTIIIKDNKTSYTFDTSNIEHLEYPRDLRFSSIVDFKKKLTDKIKATYQKSISDDNYSTFLKHFGSFKVAKIDKEEVSGQEFILEELKSIRRAMTKSEFITKKVNHRDAFNSHISNHDIDFCLADADSEDINKCFSIMKSHPNTKNHGIYTFGDKHVHIFADIEDDTDLDKTKAEIELLIRPYIRFDDANFSLWSEGKKHLS